MHMAYYNNENDCDNLILRKKINCENNDEVESNCCVICHNHLIENDDRQNNSDNKNNQSQLASIERIK